MASCWSNSIPKNKKLGGGIILLKSVSLNIFEMILTKIQSKVAFTDVDIENLMEHTKLDEIKIKHVIETLSYLHKHLSRVILKPSDIENTLVNDFNIEEDKAHTWIKLWTCDISRNFDLGNMNELQNISWELNVQSASSLFNNETLPTATILLKGTKGDTLLNLSEEELISFYNSLENIQVKLDM